MKQNLKTPIKTIEFVLGALRLGLPLALLGFGTALTTLVACNPNRKSAKPTIPASIGDNPRDIKVLLPMVKPTGNPLVVLQDSIPTLLVDLRYAQSSNVSGQRLYDPSMPAMLDAPTAKKLAAAQASLLRQGYSLKIWDAYRPPEAHLRLWKISGKNGYVADPRFGWSKHCSGRAIDVTLVDAKTGRELAMPSKFDDFTRKAAANYRGRNAKIRHNEQLLRRAMIRAGFTGINMEWWHFENAQLFQQNLPPIFADEAGITVP